MAPSHSKIKLHVWGSSHITDLHYLPESFQELDADPRYESPIWHGRSGGIINQNTINRIMSVMTTCYNNSERQVQIMFLGSNNLRDEFEGWTPEEVRDYFEMVCYHAWNLSNVHIVICGILPSPINMDESMNRFAPASSLLKELATRFRPITSYINIPDHFTSFGEVKWYFYNGKQIHLTKSGAEKLAKVFQNHLKFHPEKTF